MPHLCVYSVDVSGLALKVGQRKLAYRRSLGREGASNGATAAAAPIDRLIRLYLPTALIRMIRAPAGVVALIGMILAPAFVAHFSMFFALLAVIAMSALGDYATARQNHKSNGEYP